MHRFITRLVPLVAFALILSGCGNSSSDAAVTQPPPTLTDTFSGTLTLNGATTYNFTVTGVGSITAQLSTLSPNVSVGLSVGTWNGSICQIVLANDASVQGSVVVGSTSATGSFCVRIYDASGTAVQPQMYVIDVFHQ